MTALRHAPARRTPARNNEGREMSRRAASAERVKEMLREIAFVLHATRVVRRMGEDRPGQGTAGDLGAPGAARDGDGVAAS